MGIDARISAHAIERYQQRVASCSRRDAREALQGLLEKGRVTEKPRRWTRAAHGGQPGNRFLYCSDRPGICLVIRGGVVVTLFSRGACRMWRTQRDEEAPGGRRKGAKQHRRAETGWSLAA